MTTMEPSVDTLLALGLGLGLAAAAGMRVFVPLLILGFAARGQVVPLASGFEWLGSTPALVALGSATLLEVLAYYVPWFDNLLDTLSTPAAMVAGAVMTASVLGDLPPWLQWGVAIVGGSGAAGVVAGSTSLVRLKSTAFTGGAANVVVSTLELFGSVVTSLLAVVLPVLALITVAVILFIVYRLGRRAWTPRNATSH
jgi:hypothetical protein